MTAGMRDPEAEARALPPPLEAELRAIVGPAGLVEGEALAPYLTEWRDRWRGTTPLCVRPASPDEVARVVAACARARVPMVPQGGNTGLVGGQIPGITGGRPEVLIHLGRLDRVRAVDAAAAAIVVDAGCTLAEVQAAAEQVGLMFPLSLASEGSCQIGGNVSTNAGGVHVIRYGNMRELVLGLEVVLPDGQLWDGLRVLRKDNTGYDLKQLFIGAEGTLGIVTGAALKLVPRPREITTCLFAVGSPDAAVALLALARARVGDAVLAFELIPRLGVELALRHLPGAREPLASPAPWYVLADLTVAGSEADQVLEAAAAAGALLDGRRATSAEQARGLWRMREALSELQKHEGASLKHDVAVPVARLPEFVAEALAAVSAAVPGVRPMPFGHVGDGNLHFNLTRPSDWSDAAFLARRDEIARLVHDLVARHGGSVSAEHGVGVARRAELPRYKSALELELMRRLKRALDPDDLMNPGKGAALLHGP